MDIDVQQEDGVSIIAIPDHLDVNSSPFLKSILADSVSGSDAIELDFSKTSLVSSAGLRVLLQAQKNIQTSGKKMLFKNVPPSVMEIFDMTGVTKIFTIV